jgi:D-alanine-D-alanine ligase
MSKKIRIGLVYGGKSGEHDISLQTALAVIRAFDHSKYEITPFYISRDGGWCAGPVFVSPPESKDQLAFTSANTANGDDAVAVLFRQINGEKPLLDVVFPLLHGPNGEDGTIQGLLEMANIPYVGAGVLASSVGMDKVMMKKVFAQEGLPQCVFRHFTQSQWALERDYFIVEIEVSLGYPCLPI